MSSFPYYNEPSHDVGTVTIDSSNKSRDTAVSSAEGRLVVDASDKIFLLEPNRHPLVTLLTNVGKTWDGGSWQGSSLMKEEATNPEFSWFNLSYLARI